MESLKCPNCNSEISQIEIECEHCKFPLSGTDKEKSIFIGRQISNKTKIGDAKKSQKRAQLIIYLVALFQLWNTFIVYNNNLGTVNLWFFLILASCLFALGYFSPRKPILFISIALGLLLAYYALLYIGDPMLVLNGITWKIVIIALLIFALYNLIEEKKLKKENKFLKDK